MTDQQSTLKLVTNSMKSEKKKTMGFNDIKMETLRNAAEQSIENRTKIDRSEEASLYSITNKRRPQILCKLIHIKWNIT